MSGMPLTRRDFLTATAVASALGDANGATAQGSPMHGLIGKMIAAPGRRDELIGILLAGVSGMPGCLSYVVAKDPTSDQAIWITEVWDSADSHKASLSLPSVRDAIAKGRPLIAGFESQTVTVPIGGHGLGASPGAAASEAEVRAALAEFLSAFEQLDWERFRRCFDDAATVFFPAPTSPDRSDGRPAFEARFTEVFAQVRRAASGGPPFQRLTPEDLRVEMLGAEAAIATFHLRNAERLARRTVVLRKREAGWRIVHLHATNVPTA